jgi:hypothetical protein
MPASAITTYSQFYETCKAFPGNEWICVLAAFTLGLAASPPPAKVHLRVLVQPNPMHLFAYLTAARQVTTIHHLLQIDSILPIT